MQIVLLWLEVMDKERPLWQVLLFFFGVGFVGLLVSRKWPLASLAFVGVVAVGAFGLVSELSDPYVGPAIRQEAGIRYVVLSYFAICAGLLLPMIGAWRGRIRRRAIVGPTSG